MTNEQRATEGDAASGRIYLEDFIEAVTRGVARANQDDVSGYGGPTYSPGGGGIFGIGVVLCPPSPSRERFRPTEASDHVISKDS